jgi:hypothetical protein
MQLTQQQAWRQTSDAIASKEIAYVRGSFFGATDEQAGQGASQAGSWT